MTALNEKLSKKRNWSQKLTEVHDSLEDLISGLQSVKERKTFEKQLKDLGKVMKTVQKTNGRKTLVSCKPTGFNVKHVVKPHVLKFMGLEAGTMVSRGELNRFINQYIKADSTRQDSVNKSIILPTPELCRVLDYSPVNGEPLKFTSMQKFMSRCFEKA